MSRHYQHLSPVERVTLMLLQRDNMSIRGIARQLGRSPSTVSHELRRQPNRQQPYDAEEAVKNARANRHRCRPQRKLVEGGELYTIVLDMLRQRWSPQQISGTLARMFPDHPNYQVSHETIYKTLYAISCGELRKELIICLRQGKTKRRPRSGGVDRRQQIPDLVSIHLRPPEMEVRILPGHWEGDLIKGAFNRSAVGTLVERVSELVRHAQITQKTGTAIYFVDPHSPWQRAINENGDLQPSCPNSCA